MSLLGTQVYANDSTPLWLAANGGGGGSHVITGDLEVTGSITCSGPGINVVDDGNGYTVIGGGGTIETRLQHIQGPGPRTLLQSTDPIYFTRPTEVNGSSFLTIGPVLSVTDELTIGGTMKVVSQAGSEYAISNDGAGDMVIQTNSVVKFCQQGLTTGNSSYITSVAGTNNDVLQWGGTVSAKALELEDAGVAPVIGRATLSAGTALVNTTACDVGSYIFLTRTDLNTSTALGVLRVSNKGANDFTVVSDDAAGVQVGGDDSSFDWMIVNPA